MTQLYRHFSSDDRLLYVGVSLHAVHRLSEHKSGSAWADEISYVTIEKFDSRSAALEAEREAIKREKPLHNKIHNRPRKSRPRATFPRQPRPMSDDCGSAASRNRRSRRIKAAGFVALPNGWLPVHLAEECHREVERCREEVEAAAETQLPRGRPPKVDAG